jgi:hypothetical protein
VFLPSKLSLACRKPQGWEGRKTPAVVSCGVGVSVLGRVLQDRLSKWKMHALRTFGTVFPVYLRCHRSRLKGLSTWRWEDSIQTKASPIVLPESRATAQPVLRLSELSEGCFQCPNSAPDLVKEKAITAGSYRRAYEALDSRVSGNANLHLPHRSTLSSLLSPVTCRLPCSIHRYTKGWMTVIRHPLL